VSAAGATRPVHAAVTIALLHYLLRADGTPVADHWVAFRELPDGLFYATSFAQRAEQPIARVFASAAGIPRDELSGGPSAAVRGLHGDEPRHGLGALRRAAEAAGGRLLGLGDVSFSFTALPRVPLAVVVWAGDDELPADASILFDETAGHYLPAEDLAGLGESLSRTLVGS
jgi:hypothetical protein